MLTCHKFFPSLLSDLFSSPLHSHTIWATQVLAPCSSLCLSLKGNPFVLLGFTPLPQSPALLTTTSYWGSPLLKQRDRSPIRSVPNCYRCHLSLLGTKSSFSPAVSTRKHHPTKHQLKYLKPTVWLQLGLNQQEGSTWKTEHSAWSTEGNVSHLDKSHKSANEKHIFFKKEANHLSFFGFKSKKILSATASNPVQISGNQTISS